MKKNNRLTKVFAFLFVFIAISFAGLNVARAESRDYDYNQTVTVLAKVLYGEARGVKSTTNKACVIWCVLNRVDDTKEFKKDTTPVKAATRKHQFAYRASYPVTAANVALVKDVLARWEREKNGEMDVGRVLPKGYTFFAGKGKYNLFRNKYRGGTKIAPLSSAVYGN